MEMTRWDTWWILKINDRASRLGGLLLARQVSFCLEVLLDILLYVLKDFLN